MNKRAQETEWKTAERANERTKKIIYTLVLFHTYCIKWSDILCNERIIKYLRAYSLNGNTIYCQESRGKREEEEKNVKNRGEDQKNVPIRMDMVYGRWTHEEIKRISRASMNKMRTIFFLNRTFQIKYKRICLRTASMLMWLWIFNDTAINVDGIIVAI